MENENKSYERIKKEQELREAILIKSEDIFARNPLSVEAICIFILDGYDAMQKFLSEERRKNELHIHDRHLNSSMPPLRGD